MGKITNLLIGLVVVAFVMTGFIYFLSDLGTKTGVVFDESNYNETYNKIAEVNTISQEIATSSNTSVEVSSSDILGSYFKQGYSAYRLTLASGEITGTMAGEATDTLQLEDGSNNFKGMVMSIIGIIIILGVIISVVVGKDV